MEANEEDEWTFDQAVKYTRDARERLNRAENQSGTAREFLNETDEPIGHIQDVLVDLDEDLDRALNMVDSSEASVDKAFEYLDEVEAALANLREPHDPPTATVTFSMGGSTWTMEMTPNHDREEASFADLLVGYFGMQIDDLEAGNEASVDEWSATGVFSDTLESTSYLRPDDRQTE